MKYIIMLLIVVGLATADFLTGIIKAYILNQISSKAMRKGGLNKLGEIIVMSTAIGLEIGITALGRYYNREDIASVVGGFTAIAVFGYIVVMEIVSLVENYSEINPKANGLIKKLKITSENEEKDK